MSNSFAIRLRSLSKNALAVLIPAAGLRERDKRFLLAWYVEELTIHQIAELEHLQIESVYNAIAEARNRLRFILQNQLEVLPDNVKNIREYLIAKP